MRILFPKFLKFLSIAIMALWFFAFVFILKEYGSQIPSKGLMSWYATIALLNNFTFFFLVGLPVLIVIAPFGLFTEALWDKSEKLESNLVEEKQRDLQAFIDSQRSKPPPPKPALSEEELEELRAVTRAQTKKTADYLASYFGKDGPQPPKKRRSTAYRRGRSRRGY